MNESPSQELTFEQSLAQLDQIVRDLEDAQLGLEDALGRYEQGVRLIKECHARLQTAEQRILLVTGVEEGQPVLQPFKHEASAPARGAAASRIRRKPDDTMPF
jgi:exodeoxyribonuclease VII small subunit